MLKLIRFMKPYKLSIILILILTTMQTFGALLIPAYTAKIINNGVVYGDVDYIINTGITMLFIALLAGLASIGAIFLTSKLTSNFGKDMRMAIFKKSTYFTINDFKTIGTSSLITRNTNDVNQVQMATSYVLQFMLPAPLMALGGFILAYSKDPMLSLILIITLIALSLISYIICSKAIPLFIKLQTKMDKINKVLREIISGVRVIRAFNRESYEEDRFNNTAQEYSHLAIRVNKIFAFFLPLIILGMNLSVIAILWFGGVRIGGGNIQIGDIMAIIEYSFYIMYSVMMFSFVLIYIPRAEISANRINEVLDNNTKYKDGNYDIANLTKPVHLEFKNVYFAYEDAEEPVLSNISFEAKAGETIAIIGGTGSGKSTLTSLIPRFHDITNGNILLNGVDIRDFNQKDLRDKIGYIPQKPFLFSGTIKDSITFGNENATKEDIDYAIEVSQSKEFIDSKEKGLSEPVSQSGSNLSGGQKQRLSIARALVRKPDIYIFDDSFSALDYKTDSMLRKSLKSHIKDSIVIIVAQRISTISDADKILVLDEGKLVGMGKHKHLLETCQIYKQFAISQLNESELAQA